MPKREMRLVPTQPVVRRHHGDSSLAAGTPGEAGCLGPPAVRPPGALWRLSGATQPSAWGNPPDATAARPRRAGGVPHVASLELGTAAPAGLCRGDGPLSVLPSGDAADHRHHHAG